MYYGELSYEFMEQVPSYDLMVLLGESCLYIQKVLAFKCQGHFDSSGSGIFKIIDCMIFSALLVALRCSRFSLHLYAYRREQPFKTGSEKSR